MVIAEPSTRSMQFGSAIPIFRIFAITKLIINHIFIKIRFINPLSS